MITDFNWLGAITDSPISMTLVGLSVITLGVALERLHYYWKRRGNPDETLAKVVQKLSTGQIEEASWLCRTTGHPMGSAAMAVFQSMNSSDQRLEERLQVILSQEKLLLERNLSILGTMAAIAPLIGLLGTVWGIMRAFHDMSMAGSAAPSVVAAGVAEALVTTAAGLVVALPAVLLYNHFSRRMNVMLTVAENHARSVRGALLESSEQNGTAVPGPQTQEAYRAA